MAERAIAPVTREEFDALVKRVTAIENADNAPKTPEPFKQCKEERAGLRCVRELDHNGGHDFGL